MTEQQTVLHTPDVIIDQSQLGLHYEIRPMYDMLVRPTDIIVGTDSRTNRRIVDLGGNNDPWDFRVLIPTTPEARQARADRLNPKAETAIDSQNL